MDTTSLRSLFAYHEPNEAQARACVAIRSACFQAAQAIAEYAPDSPHLSDAVRKIREGMHAGIYAVVAPRK
jgi:hypothetical protein